MVRQRREALAEDLEDSWAEAKNVCDPPCMAAYEGDAVAAVGGRDTAAQAEAHSAGFDGCRGPGVA